MNHEPGHASRVLSAIHNDAAPAQSAIVASWCRSALRHGLDPERVAGQNRVDAAQLSERRAGLDMLLGIATPVLDQVFQAVGRSGCGVMLSDADGVILDRRVTDGDGDGFATAGLVEGARWDEALQGTNGIGTCLAEHRAVIVHRDQHFATRNIGITCIDAPVHDPHGRLVAALDVSSCRDDHSPVIAEMIATIVRDAARRIERGYFCQHFAGHRIICLPDAAHGGTALLAADRDDIVVGATRAARLRLGMGDGLAATRSLGELLGGGEQAPSFEDGDRGVLRQALARAGGNASEAARLLGIGRATLYRRMARAGIKP